MLVTNYYEELGISETSSLDDVKKSIKSNRKRYRQLTGSPNIDQRSMAERKMEIIAQAEKVFENEETRKKYDKELEISKHSSEGTLIRLQLIIQIQVILIQLGKLSTQERNH